MSGTAATHPVVSDPTADFMGVILSGLSPRSVVVYLNDFQSFKNFCGVDSAEASLRELLLRRSHAEANALVTQYRTKLEIQGLSPASISRKIASIKGAARRARLAGLTTLSIDVSCPSVERVDKENDLPREEWLQLLARAEAEMEGTPSAIHARDLLIILLLRECGLRAGEVVALDYPDDFDPERPALRLPRKAKAMPGGSAKQWNPVPERTRAALGQWIRHRGDWPGPLINACPKGPPSRRRIGVLAIIRGVKRLGVRAGLKRDLQPQMLRNAAIKQALDAGWNAGEVRAFIRQDRLDRLQPTVRATEALIPVLPAKSVQRKRGPKPKPAPEQVIEWSGLVVLGGTADPIFVLGVELQATLTRKQFKVLKALRDAGPGGLTLAGLECVCGGARAVLRGLKESHPGLRAVLKTPGKRNGGNYRIGFPNAGPTNPLVWK